MAKKFQFTKFIILSVILFCAFCALHNNVNAQLKSLPPKKNQTKLTIGRTNLLKALDDFTNNPKLKNSIWSVQVKNIKTGEIIAESNADKCITPASVMKAVTTGIGFMTLGGNYRFKTEIMYNGEIVDSVLQGNLYIKGFGDPTLGSSRWSSTTVDSVFNKWINAIKNIGINRINGKIIADVSAFDSHQVSPNWQWNDIGNYYGAGVSALNFNENLYLVYFKSGKKIGEITTIDSIVPRLKFVTIYNNVKTASPKSGDNVCIYSNPFDKSCRMEGTVPLDSSNFVVKGAIPQPEWVLMDYFDSIMNLNGIKTVGVFDVIRYGDVKDTTIQYKKIYTNESPSLMAITSITNKYSHNTFAEAIFKNIGMRRLGLGSFYTGSSSIVSLLNSRKVNTEGINISDGCGLSRNNALSASFLCNYFAYIYTTPFFKSFYESMAEAGESGTLVRLFKNQKGDYKIRAKSGTMQGVRAYAGYAKNKKGEMLSFAILVNNFSVKSAEVREIIEKLMIAIADSD